MTHLQRLQLAKNALIGLSVGDAFGESFFGEREEMLDFIQKREIPTTSWECTDDTVMAITVFNQLSKNRDIIQDNFARELAINHNKDVKVLLNTYFQQQIVEFALVQEGHFDDGF